MKALPLLLLLLLPPATAFAQPTYDLSCENVANIIVIRSEDTFLAQRSPDGIVHGVTFVLKPEALRAFQAFVEVSRQAQHPRVAKPYPLHAALSVTERGEPLQCDMLEIRGYGGKKVITFIIKEQDAFDAAHAVCPTAPIEFIILPPLHELWQKQ